MRGARTGEVTLADIWIELAKQASTLMWAALLATALLVFRGTVRTDLLPRLGSLKAPGVEMNFVERVLDKASDSATESNIVVDKTVESTVRISRDDRDRALARARQADDVLREKQILWLDDNVQNNRLERRMLEAFGLYIEQVQSNDYALKALQNRRAYDLVLSDIGRDQPSEPDGIAFLEDYRSAGGSLPVVFYVSKMNADLPIPNGAFGLTNRPDVLLHLIIDALQVKG